MKTLKRSIRRNVFSKHHKFKLDDVIKRFNLFVFNIYNFNKLYHCSKNPTFISNIDDIKTIYDVLRLGDNFKVDDNSEFSKSTYNFFTKEYKNLYFNPNKIDNENYTIDSKYLDQVFKMNKDCIYSTLTNNITFRYEAILCKFIRCFLIKKYEETIKYNNNIKKVSLYSQYLEFYKKNNENEKYFFIKYLINILIVEKEITGHFENKTIAFLASCLTGKLKYCNFKRNENCIFFEEYQKTKKFNENLSKDIGLIKKIIIGEEDIAKKINLCCNESKSIFEIIDNYYPNCKNFTEELKSEPFKFLPKMININNYFEENGYKTYKIFPTYNDPKLRHVMFDTACIDNIFLNQKYHNSIILDKEKIWNEVFKFPTKFSFYGNNKKYVFSGTIQTDGISLSLVYHTIEDEKQSKLNTKASLEVRKKDKILIENINKNVNEKYKSLNETYQNKIMNFNILEYLYSVEKNINANEIDDFILKKYNFEIEYKKFIGNLENEKKILFKIYKDKQDEFKKIYKEINEKEYKERRKILDEHLKFLKLNNIDLYRETTRKNKEFYYLDDLTESELENLRKTDRRIYIDLGKTNLIYALNDKNNKFMSYCSKERQINLGTKRYTYNTEKLNEKLGITSSNEKIKELNRKTTKYETLISNQKKLNEEYNSKYNDHLSKRFRKEKLQKYISSQKCETKMIDKLIKQLDIKNKKELLDYTLIIGDWGGCNNLKNSKTTLGIGMRRKLRKYFKNTFLLDETRTSVISNSTHEATKEAVMDILCKRENKEDIIITKRMHGILSFQMEKSKCIACKKMLYNDDKEVKVTVNSEEKIMINRFIKRDKNAVLNFKYLVEYYLLNNRERPEIFKRKQKEDLKEKIKLVKNCKIKNQHVAQK